MKDIFNPQINRNVFKYKIRYRNTRDKKFINSYLTCKKILYKLFFLYFFFLLYNILLVIVVVNKYHLKMGTTKDAGVYECTADNMYAIDRRSFKTDFAINFD